MFAKIVTSLRLINLLQDNQLYNVSLIHEANIFVASIVNFWDKLMWVITLRIKLIVDNNPRVHSGLMVSPLVFGINTMWEGVMAFEILSMWEGVRGVI